MFLDELELPLAITLAFDQFTDVAKSIGPMSTGRLTGLFNGPDRMPTGQAEQPHQWPDTPPSQFVSDRTATAP